MSDKDLEANIHKYFGARKGYEEGYEERRPFFYVNDEWQQILEGENPILGAAGHNFRVPGRKLIRELRQFNVRKRKTEGNLCLCAQCANRHYDINERRRLVRKLHTTPGRRSTRCPRTA